MKTKMNFRKISRSCIALLLVLTMLVPVFEMPVSALIENGGISLLDGGSAGSTSEG